SACCSRRVSTARASPAGRTTRAAGRARLPRPGAGARLVTAIPEVVGVAVGARALVTVVVVLATAGCGGRPAHSVRAGRPPAARTVEATSRWPISTPAAEAMNAAPLRRADLLVRRRFP